MQLLQTTDKDFSVRFKALVSDRVNYQVNFSGTVLSWN